MDKGEGMTKELPILVAEIGINGNGDIDIVDKTIEMVYDAVYPHYPLNKVFIKFQKRNPDKSTPHHMWDVPRKSLLTGQMTNYITYKREMEFSASDYNMISYAVDELFGENNWFVSVWDLDSVEWVKENFRFMPFIKIPSAHLTNGELIDAVMGTGIKPIISTGMSTEGEIATALQRMASHRKHAPVIMHCNSSYPCKDNETDLNAISLLYRLAWYEFGHNAQIGFSSHSPSPYPAIYSNFFNVDMIEFHVTLDRTMEGSDHAASLEKSAIELLARETARIPIVRGKEQLKVHDSELDKRRTLRG